MKAMSNLDRVDLELLAALQREQWAGMRREAERDHILRQAIGFGPRREAKQMWWLVLVAVGALAALIAHALAAGTSLGGAAGWLL